jgi:hypothetical protein
LTDNASPAGAKCGSDSEFASATGRTRQLEIGNVYARDQKHKADGGEQYQKEGLDVSDHLLLQWNQGGSFTGIGLRKSRSQVLRDAIHIGAGLGKRDAGLKPTYRFHAQGVAAIAEVGILPLANGNVHIALLEIPAVITEIRRNHSDDGIRNAGQREHFSQHVR